MAKNKKTHHRPGPGKPRGATYAQVLAHKAAVRKGLEGVTFYPIYVLDLSGIHYTA